MGPTCSVGQKSYHVLIFIIDDRAWYIETYKSIQTIVRAVRPDRDAADGQEC